MSIRPESGPPRLRGALPRSFVLSLAISAAVLVIPGFIVEGRSLEASQPVGAPEKSAAASESLTEQFGLARAEAAAGPPMTVHIGAAIVEWWAPDGTDVEGELVRGGTVVVTGTGHSHQGGWVDVGFRKPEGSGSPSEPTYFSIRAGDVVRLSHTDGSESVTATVPQLTAKIDPETDSISGSAEPGSTLRVVSAHPDDRLLHVLWQEGWHDSRDALLAAPVPEPGDHRSVTVDDDGGWSVLDLDRDIRAGDVAWITASDVDGNGFVLDAAAPSVLIREDGLVLGVGTSGSKTIVQMFDEDGASLGETTMQFHPRAPSWGRVQRYLPFGFGLLELERDVAIGDRIETTSRLMPESAPTFGSFIVPALTVEASDDGAIIGAAPATSDVWFGAVGPDSQAASGQN